MATNGIGASVRRKEDQRFITGAGRYTDDIDLDGQAYIAVVRSPQAHARISSIEMDAARTAPGVLAVITGAEYAATGGNALPCGIPMENRDGSKGQNRLRLIGKDTHEVVPVRWADVSPGQLQPCDHCCAPAWLERHGRTQPAEKPCLVMSDEQWWEGTLVWESSRRPDGLWWATVTYRRHGQLVTEVRIVGEAR